MRIPSPDQARRHGIQVRSRSSGKCANPRGLHPGTRQQGQLYEGELEAVGAIVEVALVELLVVQLLDAVKPGAVKL